jgi:pimeloyl-ACP methyl ester carboxylesterase
MKLYIKLIRVYLNTLSFVYPKKGGKVAVNMFQKVRIKTIKEKEKPFFEKAKPFKITREGENLQCYEMGNPEGKLLFLVHGWESNPGCFYKFTDDLLDHRIITFEMPAHANNKEELTNLIVCKEAFKTLLNHINPQESFNLISHSFGSAVSSFALSEVDYKVDKIVFLSTNNDIEDVFLDFQKMIGFNNKIYKNILNIISERFNVTLSDMVVSDRLKSANFNELLLIHDTDDKVIPFKNSKVINDTVEGTKLLEFSKIGHYRMLWNEDVIRESLNFVKEKNVEVVL